MKTKTLKIIASVLIIATLFIGNVYAEETTKPVVISIDKASVSIPNLTTTQLRAYVSPNKDFVGTPENPKPSVISTEVVWKSSNTKIAIVDKTGKVTAKKVGTVKITATSVEDNTVSAISTVKVVKRAIKLNKKKHTIKVKKSYKLKATTTPAKQKVTWKSNKPKIVKINKSTGKVTAKKVGKAKITATIKGTKIKTSCVITVKKKLPKKKITPVKINSPYARPFDKEGIIKDLSVYGKKHYGVTCHTTCYMPVTDSRGMLVLDDKGNSFYNEVEFYPEDNNHAWNSPLNTWIFNGKDDYKHIRKNLREEISHWATPGDYKHYHIYFMPASEFVKKWSYDSTKYEWNKEPRPYTAKELKDEYAIFILFCSEPEYFEKKYV